MKRRPIKIIAGLIIAGIIAAGIYTAVPNKIAKTYRAYIFTEGNKLVKEVEVKLTGKEYNGIISNDYFSGKIEIEGESVQIQSNKDKKAVVADLDLEKFYYAANPSAGSNNQGVVKLATSLAISKDFTILYGYTAGIKDKYGSRAYFKTDKNLATIYDEYAEYSAEEQKKIDLYVAAMKAAYEIENGGSGFIAVKTENLTHLSNEKAKERVLEALKDLSPQVYDLDWVKDDQTKFKLDDEGRRICTLDGSLLWAEIKEYSGDEAVVEGISWFGNLGAVFPTYKAKYKDGKWELKQISMAVS